MSKRPSNFSSSAPAMARGMSLAFEFTGAVVVFWLIGRWVDGRLGIEPWAQIVGSVIGWVGGFLHLYYKMQRLDDTGASQR